jgi:hypothetical protein
MKTSIRTAQQELFSTPSDQFASISVYRICLVRDATVSFGKECISSSQKAHSMIQKLIGILHIHQMWLTLFLELPQKYKKVLTFTCHIRYM